MATDLNPIENAWGVMKSPLARNNIVNADALWDAVKEEWERTDVVAALYESMPGRIHDVIAVDRKYTEH